MTPFAGLQAFIRSNPEDPKAIRLYVEENAPELAEAFDVEVPAMLAKLESLSDDSVGRKLVAEIKRVQKLGTESRAADKLKVAQEAASAIGAAAVPNGDGFDVNLPTLLEGALSKRGDRLVFVMGTQAVVVPMAPLYRLKAGTSKAFRKEALAYVDAVGLHVRWGSKGGLNLGLPLLLAKDDMGDEVTVNLPEGAAELAA